MLRFILRRLALIPFAALAANFLGFAYAVVVKQIQLKLNPYGSTVEGWPPVFPEYLQYLKGFLHLDFGSMPVGVGQPVLEAVGRAGLVSFEILLAAYLVSLFTGLLLGLGTTRSGSPAGPAWLVPLATIGLALPGFYIGSLLMLGSTAITVKNEVFGRWLSQASLLLPVIALALRPGMQIAQVASSLMSEALGRQYITAARSRGNTWFRTLRKHALRDILAAVILICAGALRMMMAELVVVEWLFNLHGVGRLMILTLIPPMIASPGGMSGSETVYLLHPPLLAALVTLYTIAFMLVDLLATGLARWVDPRLRQYEVGEEIHSG